MCMFSPAWLPYNLLIECVFASLGDGQQESCWFSARGPESTSGQSTTFWSFKTAKKEAVCGLHIEAKARPQLFFISIHFIYSNGVFTIDVTEWAKTDDFMAFTEIRIWTYVGGPCKVSNLGELH